MDLKTLKTFLHLSETLHFGKTSQLVHVSPSTLSRSIQQLESELGLSLFIRDNRSVELTQEGVQLQQYARDTLQNWDLFQQSLNRDKNDLYGAISIYCSVTASYSFLHEVLREFRFAYPKIEMVLHTGDTENAINRVLDGQEDVSIAARLDRMPPNLVFKGLGHSPLVMIAPTKSAYLDIRTGTLAKEYWENIPMILPEKGLFRERIDSWFADNQFLPNIYAQVGGNEAIVSMVSLGFGVGLVPKIVVDNSPLADQVYIMENQPNLASIEVGFCAKRKRLQSPLIKALWDSIAA